VRSSDVLAILRRRPEWKPAVARLRNLAAQQGDEARHYAEGYGQMYQGRRGSMVLDVVTSRQRSYRTRVLPLVNQWQEDNDEHTLHWLAAHEPIPERYGLRPGEPHTITTIARNMAAFADDHEVSEDQACRQWATEVACLEHAFRLDPVAGAVSGIGPALFAYLRMRSGADALKPDSRVAKGLRRLGFQVPPGEHAILVVAHAAAAEADIGLLALDQLLWRLDSVQ
jgi:hypothetical protein